MQIASPIVSLRAHTDVHRTCRASEWRGLGHCFTGAPGPVGDGGLGTDAKISWYPCPDAAHWSSQWLRRRPSTRIVREVQKGRRRPWRRSGRRGGSKTPGRAEGFGPPRRLRTRDLCFLALLGLHALHPAPTPGLEPRRTPFVPGTTRAAPRPASVPGEWSLIP